MSETPVVKKNKSISAIWILPLLALSLCGWLLYSSYENAGVDIEIYFNDASGLVSGKTLVMVKGIRVGLVTDLTPELKKNKVKVTVKMDKKVAPYLVEDTLFWVVRPELSAAGVAGLDTILSGSYIGIQPGNSKKLKSNFQGLTSSPPISADAPGLHLTLLTEALGSLQRGTGVYYRNLKIGSVENYALDGESGVSVNIFITPKYQHLVKEGSRFCNVSGVTIEGKISDIKVHIESFASLLRGGILLYTPEGIAHTDTVENGHSYVLYEDLDAADFGLEMSLAFPENSDILAKATKIMYRGIEVGFIRHIDVDSVNHSVVARVLLDPRVESVLREGTKFWLVQPKISAAGVDNLQTLFTGSYVTFDVGEKTDVFKDSFDLLPAPPAIDPHRQGAPFTLVSSEADFSRGAPVYFKNIKVGEVVGVEFINSGRNVETRIYIYEEYLYLMSSKSVFWSYSGITLNADFTGIDLSVSPLTKVLAGGISFTTPDKLNRQKNVPPVADQRFTLYATYKDATENVEALSEKGKYFTLEAQRGTSLNLGSPVLYQNRNIGKIVGLDLDEKGEKVLITCFVEKNNEHYITPKTKFYDASGVTVTGGLDGVSIQTGSLQSIINGGVGCFTLKGGSATSASKPYTLYASFSDALLADEKFITVHFKTLAGLKVGAPIMYKGIKVGSVAKLILEDDLKSVSAQLEVEDRVKPLFRQQTKIWLEQTEISLSKVKNLQALVMGPSVAFQPGPGALSVDFTALAKAPERLVKDGFSLVLESTRLGSLGVGSPVYYRQVKVGEVTGYSLSKTFQNVDLHINIEEPYRPLIRANTVFWNASGISVDAGIFSGVTVYTESLESIITGGIAFATPEKQEGSRKVEKNHHFILRDEVDEDWLEWSPNMSSAKQEEISK